VPAAQFPSEIHCRGHRSASGSRPCARTVERTGYAADSGARVRAVRRQTIRAPGEDQRVASVQLAGQRALPQSGGGVRTDAGVCDRHRRAAQAGFLRVDTVHQGDWDGAKGVYHVNAVDAVKQWQVGYVSKISEACLLPVLKVVLEQFPFVVHRLRPHRGRARRSDREVLCAALEPVPESSPAPRLRYPESGQAGETPPAIQGRRLSDAIREIEVAARGRAISEAGAELARLEREALSMSDTGCARRMNAAKARLLRHCKMQFPLPPPFR
jgi:hypothetical protein